MRQDMENGEGAASACKDGGYSVERVFIGTRTAEQVVADLIRIHAEKAAD